MLSVRSEVRACRRPATESHPGAPLSMQLDESRSFRASVRSNDTLAMRKTQRVRTADLMQVGQSGALLDQALSGISLYKQYQTLVRAGGVVASTLSIAVQVPKATLIVNENDLAIVQMSILKLLTEDLCMVAAALQVSPA